MSASEEAMEFLRHLQDRRNQLAETRDIFRNFAKPWRPPIVRLRPVQRSKSQPAEAKDILLIGPEHIDLRMFDLAGTSFRRRAAAMMAKIAVHFPPAKGARRHCSRPNNLC
jgi:hypothetical protein